MGTGLFGDTAARGGTRRPRGWRSGPLGAGSCPAPGLRAPRSPQRPAPLETRLGHRGRAETADHGRGSAVPCRAGQDGAGLCRAAPHRAAPADPGSTASPHWLRPQSPLIAPLDLISFGGSLG